MGHQTNNTIFRDNGFQTNNTFLDQRAIGQMEFLTNLTLFRTNNTFSDKWADEPFDSIEPMTLGRRTNDIRPSNHFFKPMVFEPTTHFRTNGFSDQWAVRLSTLNRDERSCERTTHYALRTTHYALRTTHYALRTTHYALRTTHYALRSVAEGNENAGFAANKVICFTNSYDCCLFNKHNICDVIHNLN